MPLYVLNVAYPLIDDEMAEFCAGKTAVLLVEEGAPEYIEHSLNTILRRRDIQTKVAARMSCRWAGIYRAGPDEGHQELPRDDQRVLLGNQPPLPDPSPVLNDPKIKALAEVVPPRPRSPARRRHNRSVAPLRQPSRE